jgi:hypothetical protein
MESESERGSCRVCGSQSNSLFLGIRLCKVCIAEVRRVRMEKLGLFKTGSTAFQPKKPSQPRKIVGKIGRPNLLSDEDEKRVIELKAQGLSGDKVRAEMLERYGVVIKSRNNIYRILERNHSVGEIK